ncbi:MAG: S41 family peptidase [Defluviitaleaceae bacterium]|nr:S41 family peptidase [Defluviitaleaceae bacterium]
MKKFRFLKCSVAFTLSLLLALGTVSSVEASGVRNNPIAAGQQLAEVIDLIMTYYVGDPMTVEKLLEAALNGISDVLDEYSGYLTAEEFQRFRDSLTGRMRGVGITLTVQDDGRVEISNVLPDTPASYAGLRQGDIIISVDNVDVVGASLEFIRTLIVNPEMDWVLIGVDRAGNTYTFNIEKAEIITPTVIVERLEELPEAQGLGNVNNFRIMQIISVGAITAEDVGRALLQMQEEGVEGIVLDLRGNAGGYVDITMDIANMLVPHGIVLQTVNRSGDRYIYSSLLPEVPFNYFVVLVDRFTASAAEVIASALQDSGAAVIVGEPTFGKGSVQSLYSVPTGGAFVLTTEEYFRRSGETINGVGVIPCIEVTSSRQADELDAALRTGLEILLAK